MKKTGLILVLAVAAAAAQAAPFVVLKNNVRKDGTAIRARPDGTVVLTDANGQQLTLTKEQYIQAVTDKPATLDAAAAAVSAKKFDEAIPALKKIMEDTRFLEWDKQAAFLLAKAHEGKSDAAGAIAVYEQLFRDYPALEAEPQYGWGYRQALVAAKQVAKLEPKLDKLIAEGARGDAARAQILRGDIRASEGKSELAIRDYLRTVLFFEKERDVMPTALSRAAGALDKLRDPRAKELYKRIVEEFPQSAEAAAARSKI